MQIPETLKKPPVIIGGIILFVIILLASRKSQSGTSASPADINAANQLATQQANIQIAQINASLQARQAELGATERISLAKIATDENVTLQTSAYQYDIANRQLENNRILGLTKEDTTRLLSTQENQTRLTLGVTALDTQRYLGERALASQEAQQAREIQFRTSQLESQERVADFSSSRALTYAQIQGQAQVDAIKATRPKWYESLLGGIGGGLGSLIGGLF